MTQEKRNEFHLGSGYWNEYVQLNGYAFYPNDAGLKKLAIKFSLEVSHLRKCINTYLEA